MRIDTLPADAEDNHATGRGEPGIRATVTAPNGRGSRKWPKATYRRPTVRRFRKKREGSRHRRVYGQRWQVGGVLRRLERRPGAAAAAIVWATQQTEILLAVVAHHIMLLAAKVSTEHPGGERVAAKHAG